MQILNIYLILLHDFVQFERFPGLFEFLSFLFIFQHLQTRGTLYFRKPWLYYVCKATWVCYEAYMRSLLSSQRSRLRWHTKACQWDVTHPRHNSSMSPIISEILKIKANSTFTLDSPAFSSLRETPIKFGVKEQYYGKCTDEPDTLIWVVRASDPSYTPYSCWSPIGRLAQGC